MIDLIKKNSQINQLLSSNIGIKPLLNKKITVFNINRIEELSEYILLTIPANNLITHENNEVNILINNKLMNTIKNTALNIMNINHVENKYIIDLIIDLTAFLLTIRLIIEMKDSILSFKRPSQEEAIDDFNRLKKYQSTANDFSSLSLISQQGMKAANYFTASLRNKASKIHLQTFKPYPSPEACLESNKSNIFLRLRKTH